MYKKFFKNEKGVGAIEFAIMLPMIFVFYAGFVTLTTANKTSGQVSQVASTVSDLLAQSTQLTTETIDNVLKAGEAIAGTHNAINMEIEVVGVAIDDDENVSVVWSRDKDGQAPHSVGSSYNLPAGLDSDEGFVVASEARLQFTPSILPSYLNFVSIPITYKFYFVPRGSLRTNCSAC